MLAQQRGNDEEKAHHPNLKAPFCSVIRVGTRVIYNTGLLKVSTTAERFKSTVASIRRGGEISTMKMDA